MLPYLRSRAELPAVIKSRTLRTAGLGESVIDERIGDLERMTNPTVGLAAHPGRVDIRITAKASNEMEADELLWGVEATLQQRLGDPNLPAWTRAGAICQTRSASPRILPAEDP